MEAPLEVEAAPAPVRAPEIARGPGHTLLHAIHAGHAAVIQGQDRGQGGQDLEVVVVEMTETSIPLTKMAGMKDTGYTLLI